jgi:hypothetical protein
MVSNVTQTKNPILCPDFLTAAINIFVPDSLFSNIVLTRFLAEGVLGQRKQTHSTTPTRKPITIQRQLFNVITVAKRITSPPAAT